MRATFPAHLIRSDLKSLITFCEGINYEAAHNSVLQTLCNVGDAVSEKGDARRVTSDGAHQITALARVR
jgi:hypothetical protein